MSRISIITPLHNKGPYIAETIASVQAQTIADWEMIVVENGSSDDGPEQVEAAAMADPRIRLVRAPQDVRGPCAARNLGLDQAVGEWVLFLDADDLIEPDHLENLQRAGQATGADLSVGGWREFIEGRESEVSLRDGPQDWETASHVLERAFAGAPWAIHAALVRREWLGTGRRWPVAMERLASEDSVFWFQVLMGAKLVATRCHGAVYRKETSGHRDADDRLAHWVETVLKLIRLNEEYLLHQGLWPSPGQAGNAVRTLEALWLRCREAGLGPEAAAVDREFSRWLTLTSNEPGFLLRRLVGIRGFSGVRRALSKFRA